MTLSKFIFLRPNLSSVKSKLVSRVLSSIAIAKTVIMENDLLELKYSQQKGLRVSIGYDALAAAENSLTALNVRTICILKKTLEKE